MLNYKKLNFKCGLEIHQQLNTKKLFCSCSSSLNEKELQVEVKRKIKAAAGEFGNIDIAAKFEQAKDLNLIYHGYTNEYCLIDLDEEPIHYINHESLKTALELATLLKMKIPPVLQVMRKIVIDGSAISSFQRTVQIGLESENSFIESSKGRVRISSLCLEEDSCKIVSNVGNTVIYSLSRIGIPLIELRTEPDIQDPVHAKEIAEYLGMVLRSFDAVKRGIGTIRQDVNLSIKNMARVEIKGFQDLKSMPKIIEREVKRQLDLLRRRQKLRPEVRKANEDLTTTFLRPMPGSSRMYPESDHHLIFITEKMLSELKLPELIVEKTLKLAKKYKISSELATQLIKENKQQLFESLVKLKVDPSLVANTLILMLKDIKSRYNLDTNKLNEGDLEFLFKNITQNKISKNAIENVLIDMVKGKKIDLANYKEIPETQLIKEIKKLIWENTEAQINALMGIIMDKYRGRVDGKRVMELLQKLKQ
ncbi:MAG: Glu-tRNA(Gln) amidotransferase subunit GatE [Nanoarchaeota archaeon]